jgi:hypothetical protein
MARWVAFNLREGRAQERQLIQVETLREIHSPQMVVGKDPAAPTPGAAYAMGWFVDRHNCCARIGHGGYMHDVNSDVSLFPEYGVGIVSTTNFGCPRLARLMNQLTFDLLCGREPVQTWQEKLAAYEKSIEERLHSIATAHRVPGTSPSHPLKDYEGRYIHPAYGTVVIRALESELTLERGDVSVNLQHWHYDAWVARDEEALFSADESHPFDRSNPVLFTTSPQGTVNQLLIRFEPRVAAIAFERTAS